MLDQQDQFAYEWNRKYDNFLSDGLIKIYALYFIIIFFRLMMQNTQSRPLKEGMEGLYGHDPHAYWKHNYHFNLSHNSINSTPFFSLSDRIQWGSIVEHLYIVREVIEEVDAAVQEADFGVQEFDRPLYEDLNHHNADYFFADVIELAVFPHQEAEELRLLFGKRQDWQKLCLQLIKMVNPQYHCELTYIFYLVLKLVKESKSIVRLTTQQLGELLLEHLAQHAEWLKQRLPMISLLPEETKGLYRVGLSMVLAIYGIFSNPFCARRSEKFKQFQYSIKHQEKHQGKPKNIKILNLKTRPGRLQTRLSSEQTAESL